MIPFDIVRFFLFVNTENWVIMKLSHWFVLIINLGRSTVLDELSCSLSQGITQNPLTKTIKYGWWIPWNYTKHWIFSIKMFFIIRWNQFRGIFAEEIMIEHCVICPKCRLCRHRILHVPNIIFIEFSKYEIWRLKVNFYHMHKEVKNSFLSDNFRRE